LVQFLHARPFLRKLVRKQCCVLLLSGHAEIGFGML